MYFLICFHFYPRYEPKEVLGKGISSVVRKCVEKSTGIEYAVKIVEYDEAELKESTLREIEIMRLIGGHPNISKLQFLTLFMTFKI